MKNINLDLYRSENYVVNDAFDRLAINLHSKMQKQGAKSVAVVGCEPGVGSTFTAVSIAISMADAGWKTLLIDADLRKGMTKKRLNQNAKNGLAEFLEGFIVRDNAMYTTNYECLHYIPCGTPKSNPVRLFCSKRLTEFLDELKEEYDFIIMDLPSVNASVDGTLVASKVDGVIITSSHGSTSTKQIKNAVNEMENVGANIFGAIANRVEKDEYKKYMKNYDYFKKEKDIEEIK